MMVRMMVMVAVSLFADIGRRGGFRGLMVMVMVRMMVVRVVVLHIRVVVV